MSAQPRTIPHEIVDCIAHGREPSAWEIWRVADHILRDIIGDEARAGFNQARADARHLSFRAARAALAGCH